MEKDMINGIAIILLVIVCCVVAYIAFATGYERGKIDGYAEGIADAIDSENPNIY